MLKIIYCLNGSFIQTRSFIAKWFSKSIISFIAFCCFFATGNIAYAEKVCINDDGSGDFIIPDANNNTRTLGVLNKSILFPTPLNPVDVGSIFDVNVELDISTTWVSDLTSRLTSPDTGEEITLFERPGNPDPEAVLPPFNGDCAADNIDAIFDDQSSNPRIDNEPCTAAVPVFSGDYKPHDSAPDNLSIYNDENPVGNWGLYISDAAGSNIATINEACVDIQYAGVTFDKWVSTNATCSDPLLDPRDDLTVSAGTPVFYCYIVSNPSTETFTINAGGTSDKDIFGNQGHDISGLEGLYVAGSSNTVIVPLIAGIDTPLGETINIAEITATFATPNFTGELITEETARLNVPPPVIEISKTVNVISDPVNVNTNPKAIPNSIVEYTIAVKNSGFGSTDIDTIIVNDPLPADTRLCFVSPTNPVSFSDGPTLSGLSFNFVNLASTTDDIEFSNDSGLTTVIPTPPDASGCDTTPTPINHISIKPKGIFNSSSNGTDTPSFEIKFRVRVE